jgi:polyvinyl alcohol dehydrogenase (cytochrome)
VSHRSRSMRHLGPILAVVVMAMALLVGPGGQGATPVAASNARATRDASSASAVTAGTAAQAAQCVTATNLDHALRSRAWRILIFVWARGSNNYLGLILDRTSVREGPAGTWTKVDNCNGGPGPEPEVEDWPSVGRDLGSTRAALNENTVTAANIATLGRAWEDANALGVSGTPIVVDDVVYYGDWNKKVHARNATTGEQLWATDVGERVPGAVAVDGDRVYAGTWDGRLVALNRQTGAKLWEKEVDTHPVTVIYGSPVVANGTVIVPVSSDEWWGAESYTFRGSVVAFDAATGNQKWRYWTSCGPQNAGRDNCPAGANEGAGAATWAYPTIDTQRNTLYFGTGNQYAAPASNRSDAIVALDVNTGQQKWVRQFTAGDIWNIPDVGSPDVGPDADAMVATLFKVGGVDAVGIGDKGGTYYAVNRETGAVLWSRKLTEGSIQGGVMASAAVVPAARAGRPNDVLYITSNRGGTSADLFAIDTSNGEIITRVDVGGSVVSPVSWANGLVYVTDNSGHVSAFDGANGLRRVWQWRTDAPAAGGIAIAGGMVYTGWGWAVNGVSQKGGLIAYKLGGEQQGGGPEPPDGASIYATNCAVCHGADGSGGAGPDLRGIGEMHTVDELVQVITNGRGGMPAWRDELSAEEIRAVATYVSEIPGDGHEHDHDEPGTTTTTTRPATTTTSRPGTTTTTAPATTTTTHGGHDH